MVKGLPKTAWMPIFVTLSARTSAGAVQEQIEGRLDKRRKGVVGPPPGQKCLIFVDDLNMPAKETFGAQVGMASSPPPPTQGGLLASTFLDLIQKLIEPQE